VAETNSKAELEKEISFPSPTWTRSSKRPRIGLELLLYSINTPLIHTLRASHIT